MQSNAEFLQLACDKLGKLARQAEDERQYGHVAVAIVYQSGRAKRIVEAREASHE